MQRKGIVPIPVPGGLGLEAAGRVTAVGAAVTALRVPLTDAGRWGCSVCFSPPA